MTHAPTLNPRNPQELSMRCGLTYVDGQAWYAAKRSDPREITCPVCRKIVEADQEALRSELGDGKEDA